MYRKILLTLDGSQLARAAVPHVGKLAAGTETEVIVLEVIDPMKALRMQALGEYEFTDGDPQRCERMAQEMHFTRRDRALHDLQSVKAELQGAGICSIRTEVAEGMAANEIVDCGVREGCDAIVMATREHDALGKTVVGSVAEYVLQHAGHMAVLLVGPDATA